MRSVLILLSLMLIASCTTTEYVTEYKTIHKTPPAYLTVECEQPFFAPPRTYGEAFERDPIWLNSWKDCAEQIEGIREYLGYEQK